MDGWMNKWMNEWMDRWMNDLARAYVCVCIQLQCDWLFIALTTYQHTHTHSHTLTHTHTHWYLIGDVRLYLVQCVTVEICWCSLAACNIGRSFVLLTMWFWILPTLNWYMQVNSRSLLSSCRIGLLSTFLWCETQTHMAWVVDVSYELF